MKSRVTSKRFGSTNENRASHFASPIGRETICMYANSVWVNCITWHSVMTKMCWMCGCGSDHWQTRPIDGRSGWLQKLLWARGVSCSRRSDSASHPSLHLKSSLSWAKCQAEPFKMFFPAGRSQCLWTAKVSCRMSSLQHHFLTRLRCSGFLSHPKKVLFVKIIIND